MPVSQQGIIFSFVVFVLPCVFFSEKPICAVPRSGSAAWSSCFQSARSFDARLSQSEDVYEALAQQKRWVESLPQRQGPGNPLGRWGRISMGKSFENMIENGRILQGSLNYLFFGGDQAIQLYGIFWGGFPLI